MPAIKVTELEGDGIGAELQESVATVTHALPIELEFERVDWSLATREREGDAAIDAAEESMRNNKLALKYPTVTKSRSPNALIRRRLGFSVIYRPCISIEGIQSHFKQAVNLHIVRIATGGTYEDPGQFIGHDAAVSIRVVEREPCAQAARFAFDLARKKGLRLTSSSKHTVQKITDGLFEEVVRDVSRDYSDVEFGNELFDALLAKIILNPAYYQVVLVLNEYGDFLSDMSSGLVGSIGTGASGNYSFNPDRSVDIAMFDPAGGTAPDIAGKNLCNPSAMLLAFGMLLDHIDRYDLGHALRLALLGSIRDGETTRDLGGSLGTREFTHTVVRRLDEQLEKS
ncbi:MAG: hypothetical protein LJE70_00040 [Chromatiaceae bacterium]|nr:hypothetical protein [Chromatiaceae bacterium]